MASAAEQLAANLNFGAFAKAEELKKRIWFTLGALLVYRLGHLHPAARHRSRRLRRRRSARQAGGILGMFNMFAGGARPPHGDLRAEHHAVHLGLDHHPAADHGLAAARSAEEGRRGGPQDCSTSTPAICTVMLAAFQSYGIAVGLEGAGNVVSDPGMFFRLSTVDHADRRHHVPDVARRADHLARHRQRHLADHLRRHRRRAAAALADMLELGRQGALSTGLHPGRASSWRSP